MCQWTSWTTPTAPTGTPILIQRAAFGRVSASMVIVFGGREIGPLVMQASPPAGVGGGLYQRDVGVLTKSPVGAVESQRYRRRAGW